MNVVVEGLSDIQKVSILEEEILKYPQTEIPLRHYFSHGVYAREIFIPKGTLLTGKIHKYEHLNIMSQGELSVLTQDGVVRVKAPFTVISPPGTKRIAYAHEDTVWTTIHATNETDVEKIEAYFIANTEQEYLTFQQGLLECLS
jgi:hypothetical protein